MKIIIKLFGVLLLLAGVTLVIKPSLIIDWLQDNIQTTFIYITAIAVRLILGILFLLTAKESKYPKTIKVLGYLFVLSAIALVFMTQGNFHNFMSEIIPEFTPYATISGLVSIVFGSFLIYAFKESKSI